MIKPVLLDNFIHKNLKVVSAFGATYGDNISMVTVVPQEFRYLIAHYPLFIIKDGNTEKISFAALLGFEKDENLFLGNGSWNASYIPLNVQRQPFLIDIKEGSDPDQDTNSLTVFIDIESNRINDRGQALFLENGEQSDYFKRIINMLKELARGDQLAKKIIDEWINYDLISPLNLNIQYKNSKNDSLEGLNTINEERFKSLSADELLMFHQNGQLELMHFMIASLAHIQTLVDAKNARLP